MLQDPRAIIIVIILKNTFEILDTREQWCSKSSGYPGRGMDAPPPNRKLSRTLIWKIFASSLSYLLKTFILFDFGTPKICARSTCPHPYRLLYHCRKEYKYQTIILKHLFVSEADGKILPSLQAWKTQAKWEAPCQVIL